MIQTVKSKNDNVEYLSTKKASPTHQSNNIQKCFSSSPIHSSSLLHPNHHLLNPPGNILSTSSPYSDSVSDMFNAPFVLLFALLLTLPLIILFAPHILPPKRLTISISDESDDLALFRRAVSSTRHRPGSVQRLGSTNAKPKIAFLFLTNTDLHFAPIWQLFFNPAKSSRRKLYNIYVHADPDSDVKSPGGVFENRFIPAKKTQRSSPTLISAARRLLANAVLDDPLNSYFALVSQNCIPLHSFSYVYNTLFQSQLPKPSRLSFTEPRRPSRLSDTKLNRPSRLSFNEPSGPSRLSYIEVLSEEPQLWDRYIARGKNVMLPEIPFDKFRIGSQFYILTRTHALTVINDRKLWKKFRLPCLNVDSCYPEEHYFPTLLSMEDPKGVSEYTLTNVNWTGSVDGHPYMYSPAEVSPELIRRLRVSNSSFSYLFGRKFSPECLVPLMKIAEKVIFRD
ncbi:putative glycosyl transferase, family 14 [Helianthus debilis subsp. tardiflorus]